MIYFDLSKVLGLDKKAKSYSQHDPLLAGCGLSILLAVYATRNRKLEAYATKSDGKRFTRYDNCTKMSYSAWDPTAMPNPR